MADVTEQEGILSPMQLENDVNEDVEAQEELTSQQYEAPPAPWRRAKGLWSRIKAAAKELKTNITTLWYASGDPRTPISAKLLAYFVLGIALSPIDIIPDFIPVLGILDDIILVPLGIWFAVKLIPNNVWEEARERAEQDEGQRLPSNWYVAVLTIILWIAFIAWAGKFVWEKWIQPKSGLE